MQGFAQGPTGIQANNHSNGNDTTSVLLDVQENAASVEDSSALLPIDTQRTNDSNGDNLGLDAFVVSGFASKHTEVLLAVQATEKKSKAKK